MEEDSLLLDDEDNEDNEDLKYYFLSDKSNSQDKPPDSVFHINTIITGAKRIQWSALCVIHRKKHSNKVWKIFNKKMIKDIVDRDVTYYAQNHNI